MGIVCVGQSAYDITVPVDSPIIDNQKYRIHSEFQCGGGPALNAACLCALWGAPVELVSRIGRDNYGMKLREILDNFGVQVEHLISDDVETPYSYIFVNAKNGNRTIFNKPAHFVDVNYSGNDLDVDVILSDGHEDEISVQLIQQYPDAISIVDAGTFRESTMNVARHVDYLVCSEDFARQYTGKAVDLNDWTLCEEIFAKVKGINQKQAVITLGEKGLLYEEGGKLKRLEAYKVKAVDTTGAGDIFHGAFAYGVYQKMPLLDNLKQCSMTAAISVQTLGGQASIPKLATVQDKLKENN